MNHTPESDTAQDPIAEGLRNSVGLFIEINGFTKDGQPLYRIAEPHIIRQNVIAMLEKGGISRAELKKFRRWTNKHLHTAQDWLKFLGAK